MTKIIDSNEWQDLKKHFDDIKNVQMRDLFKDDKQRFEKFHLALDDFLFDFSKNRIHDKTLDLLNKLAIKADAEGWRDGFRIFNSESENYTWWSYQSNSRSRNVGWRIDAFWLSPKASQGAKRCIHLYKPELSDHCPVLLDWEMPSIFT